MGNIEWLSEVADEPIKCNLLHMNSGNVSKKIAFYVSHRLSSCQFCDEITVFDAHKMINSFSIPINYNETRALIASSNKRGTESLNLEEFIHLI